MDRIQIILEKNGPRASTAPLLGLYTIIFKQIGIYSRSQVRVYRTIGPLVIAVTSVVHVPIPIPVPVRVTLALKFTRSLYLDNHSSESIDTWAIDTL